MNKAAVTGGGGFIGLAIVRQLLERNIEPVVIGRNTYPEIDALGIETRTGDIQAKAFLEQAFTDCDTVFHAASKTGIWGKWDEYHSINVIGTDNVIAACKSAGVERLIYTSSPSVVFDKVGISGSNENIPYAKTFLCHYAQTKAMAEQLVRKANGDELKTCAIRPHLVWGPGDQHLLPRLIARGRARKLKKIGTDRNLVDITYIDNAAHAHLLAADNLANSGTAGGQAYFISQGEPVHLWEWVNTLFQRIGVPKVTGRISYRKAYLAGSLMEHLYKMFNSQKEPPMTRFLVEQLAKSHWFTLERAERELGYKPLVNHQEGMHRTVAWLKEQQGSLPSR